MHASDRIISFWSYLSKPVRSYFLDFILLWEYSIYSTFSIPGYSSPEWIYFPGFCMIRKIYHGSSRIVRPPHFGAGDPYNDFGLGFYCTEDHDTACEWAVGRGRNGFLNKYSINDTGLRIIDLTSPQYTPLHWLSILANFREFDTSSSLYYQCKEYIRSSFGLDYQNCDCIIGPRADNTNFAIAQDFMNGLISYRQLKDTISSGASGKQFVLKSNRAFDRIVFDGYEAVLSNDHYPSRVTRETEQMRKASSTEKTSGLYITDILEHEIRPYDLQLR